MRSNSGGPGTDAGHRLAKGVTAASHALSWLAERQQPDGHFVALRTDIDASGATHRVYPDGTPFLTARIIISLDGLATPLAAGIRQRAAPYLSAQPRPWGACHYWERGHHLHQFIPADVDDTASVAEALQSLGLDTGDAARLVRRNTDERGLVYTWIVPRWPPRWCSTTALTLLHDLSLARLFVFWRRSEARRNDIDAVVNAQVATFLGPEATPPAVAEFLIGLAQSRAEDEADKWYHGRCAFYCAASRAFSAGHLQLASLAQPARERLEAIADASGQIGGDVLQTAQALVALVRFGHSGDPIAGRAADYLILSQHRDGGWDHAPYFWGGPLRRVYWGSRELTTAICIEALCSYYQRQATDSRFSPSLLPPVLALET